MDNRFLKVFGFIVVAIVLAAAFRFVTRERLGLPEESHRLRHPDGYSIVGPVDWAGSILQSGKAKQPLLKFVPQTNLGVQPSLLVMKSDKPFTPPAGIEVRDSARPIEFQGHPATYYEGSEPDAWMFVLDFQRGSDYFRIGLKLPVHEDVIRGNWWKHFETFRLETPITSTTGPTSMPSLIVPK